MAYDIAIPTEKRQITFISSYAIKQGPDEEAEKTGKKKLKAIEYAKWIDKLREVRKKIVESAEYAKWVAKAVKDLEKIQKLKSHKHIIVFHSPVKSTIEKTLVYLLLKKDAKEYGIVFLIGKPFCAGLDLEEWNKDKLTAEKNHFKRYFQPNSPSLAQLFKLSDTRIYIDCHYTKSPYWFDLTPLS